MVDREEGDPDTAEHQHAECQELGFIECVRQVSGHESHSEGCQGQEAQVSQDTVEESDRATPLFMNISMNQTLGLEEYIGPVKRRVFCFRCTVSPEVLVIFLCICFNVLSGTSGNFVCKASAFFSHERNGLSLIKS